MKKAAEAAKKVFRCYFGAGAGRRRLSLSDVLSRLTQKRGRHAFEPRRSSRSKGERKRYTEPGSDDEMEFDGAASVALLTAPAPLC